jgi:hypothetical protein
MCCLVVIIVVFLIKKKSILEKKKCVNLASLVVVMDEYCVVPLNNIIPGSNGNEIRMELVDMVETMKSL